MKDKFHCDCFELVEAIDRYLAKSDDDLEKRLSEAGYTDAKKSVSDANSLEDNIYTVLNEQSEYISQQIADAESLEKALELVDDMIEDGQTRERLIELFEAFYIAHVPKFAESYLRETEGDMVIHQIRQRTSHWIFDWAHELSDIMQLSSEDKLGDLIQGSIDAGESVEDLKRKILEDGIRDDAYRARATSLTEMLRAHSVARDEGIMQSPASSGKKWLHSGGYKNNPRANHIDMDGQIVDKDKPFVLTGMDGITYYPKYPRDSNLPPGESINCHCTHVPVVDENVLGMTLEEREELQKKIIEEDDGEWEKELDARNRAKAGIEIEEGETSKVKYDYAVTVIDRKQIASAEYRKRYSVLPETKKVQRKVAAEAKTMLRHRSGSKYEDLSFVDSTTGKVLTQTGYRKQNEVSPTKAMKKMLKETEEYTIIGIHNHPSSSTPSIQDIYAARDRKYKYGIVAGHDGTIYKYSARGEINDPMVTGALDYLEKAKYTENEKICSKMTDRALENLRQGGVEMEVL